MYAYTYTHIQGDVVINELSVRESLEYSAALRLNGTTRAEVHIVGMSTSTSISAGTSRSTPQRQALSVRAEVWQAPALVLAHRAPIVKSFRPMLLNHLFGAAAMTSGLTHWIKHWSNTRECEN